MTAKGTKGVLAILITISVIWIIISVGGLFLYVHVTSPPAFTDEQCKVVKQNFDKLKVGMTKEQVIPLIGGEREVGVIFNPGKFPEQQNRWEVWALCNNPQKDYEWYFIAFDTKTNKVVKIFSGFFDEYGND